MPDSDQARARSRVIRAFAPLRAMLVLLFLSVIFPRIAAAQINIFDEDWRWASFATDGGLPSNNILRIVETESGTPWALTSAGLAWYDGYEWNTIDSSRGLPSSNGISKISPANGDSILVVAGHVLYAGSRDGFRRVLAMPVDDAVMLHRQVLILANSSLLRIERGNLFPFAPGRTLTENATFDLYRTQGGAIWLNTESGLLRWDGTRWQIRLPGNGKRYLVNCLAEDSTGSGMVSLGLPTNLRGLWEWDSHGPMRRSPHEVGDFIKAATIAPDGMIFTTHYSGDIRIRAGHQWNALTTRPGFLHNLNDVLFRNTGDVWIATEHGLYLYRQSSTRWSYQRFLTPDPRNRIHEIFRAGNGDLWVATAEGVFHQSPGGFSRSITAIGNDRLFEATGIGEDSIGGIWISGGFGFNGAYRWNGAQWEWHRIDSLDTPFRIHKIRRDLHGRLWFLGISLTEKPSGETDPGAYVLDNGRFVHWGIREGLPSGRVYAFAETRDGAYWFGTAAGLSRWKNGVWKHWTVQNGLRQDRVFTLAADKDNVVWFGDRHSGLGQVDPNLSIRYFTASDGLVDDRVWDLNVDDEGTLWIATEDGLSSYYRGSWATFNSRTGLDNPTLWPVLPTKEKIYVGTLGSGLAILNMRESAYPPPRITIEAPISEKGTAFIRWQPRAFWGEVPQHEILTRFRVDGGSWSGWDVRRDVILNDLSTGTHTFEVQGKGLFGGYDPYGRKVVFTTAMPFYRNWIVLSTLGTLLLAVILLGLILLRRKQEHDAEIRESEAKFRAVTETTSSAIFIYSNGHFLYLNQGAELLTGFTRTELFKMYLWEMVHPDYRDMVRQRGFDREAGEEVESRYEFKIVTKNGDERWLDFTASRILYQGRPAVLGTAFDITERKSAEEALRRQELEYRILLDHVPAMIWFKDGNNRILRLNDAAARSLGKTVEQLEGVSTYDLFPAEHAEQYHLDDLEVINSGISKLGIIERYRLASGEDRWIMTDKIPYRTANDRIIGVIVFSQDITERKRTEMIQAAVYGIEQAAASTERLDELFVSVHAILADVMYARNFYIALYDESEDMLSFPYFKDEIDPAPQPRKPGHGLTEYVIRKGVSLLCDQEKSRMLIEEGEADIVGAPSPIWLGVPLIVDRKAIGVMTVQHYSDPHAFGEQELHIMEFVSSQIAKAIQRKMAEDALRESEERYRTLFEESEDTVFISSPEGRLIDINPAGLRLFGYSTREELLKADIVHDLYLNPEDRAIMVRELTSKGSVRELELMVRRRDGSIRTVLETANAVYDNAGNVVTYRGILRDITDRKQLEQQLVQAQKLESIGTLAGGIAHDFNNILTIILGYASIIERKSVDQAAFEKNLNAIRSAAHRGANLVRQLLTFARKTDVLPVPTNINTLVGELTKLLEATFPKTIDFRLDLGTTLPQIIGDQNQIHQAILNLCVNARDAMAGGGTLTLRTSIVPGGHLQGKYTGVGSREFIGVSVEDTGIGMDEQTQRRIFEPFFTTKEIGKGTGLGLALVYGVMQSHEGFVDVQSTQGVGTTFTLYFPVTTKEADKPGLLHEGTVIAPGSVVSSNRDVKAEA